jgi:hypothetical protein
MASDPAMDREPAEDLPSNIRPGSAMLPLQSRVEFYLRPPSIAQAFGYAEKETLQNDARRILQAREET